MSDVGDNSGAVHGGQPRAFVERIERVNSERDALADDLKDIYAEIKSTGLDGKIVKRVIAIRRMDPDKRREEETILDLYLSSLGIER